MTSCLLAAAAWTAVGVVVGLLLGRAIRQADELAGITQAVQDAHADRPTR